jgi:cellobiose-specific phosphotransferase system component IIC
MNEKIIPKIMAFINLKGIQAIKDGMVYSMPLLIVGSVFLIITNFPVQAVVDVLEETGIKAVLEQANGATFNISAMIAVLGIYFLFPFLHKYVILFSSRAERILQDSSACFFIISMPAYSGQISQEHKERLG